MPDAEGNEVKSRQWNAYVCPDCRVIFRVPRDHDGKGIVCPSCRVILRIPGEGDVTMPLMPQLKKVEFSEEQEPESRVVKKRKEHTKRKAKNRKVPEWDARSGKWRSASSKGVPKQYLILGLIAVIITMLGILAMMQERTVGSKKSDGQEESIEVDFGDDRLIPSE